MAEQVYRLGSINGDAITADMIWDDVSSNAIALLYTNTTMQDDALVVTKKSGNVVRSITLPAQSVAVRDDLPSPLSVTFDARGNIRGWRFSMVWPS